MEGAHSRLTRIAPVVREIARGGLAGLIGGTLVGGIGGRLVMSAAAVINPQATGAFTSNGELIGRFTVEGTLALFVFGGLAAGMVAGVVWVVVAPWLPWAGTRRWLLAGALALSLGASFLIESENADFVILDQIPLVLLMLAALVALLGAAVAWLDERLERRMPPPSGRADVAFLGWTLIVVLGLLPLAFALLAYLSPTFSDRPRPQGVGAALLVAGVATVSAWIIRIRSGRHAGDGLVRIVGLGGVAIAAVLGALHLAGETAIILGR